jgi:hypothetical protein
MTIFDKKLLFVGKSIIKGKDRIKKKNRAKGNGTKGVFFSIHAEIERPPLGRWLRGLTGRCLRGLFGP